MNTHRMMDLPMPTRSSGRLLKKLLPIVVLAAGIGGFFAAGLDQYVTFEALRENRETLNAFVADNGAFAALVYVAIYAAAVAFSLPGGAIMTLAGGFLFGAAYGTMVVVVAATLGATALFLIARSALVGSALVSLVGEHGKQAAGPLRDKVREIKQGMAGL